MDPPMDDKASRANHCETHVHEPDLKNRVPQKAGSKLFGWLTAFLELIIAALLDFATTGL